MNILIVEDNQQISDNIKEYLSIEGYNIDQAFDGNQGLIKSRNVDYDIIVLDVMLPGIDGFTFAKELKKIKNIPIIMATAKSELEDKKEGYGSGVDDYITKPYDLEELSMRIKAILKRTNRFEKLEYKNIVIDFTQKIIFKKGEEIKLTIKEFNIIKLMVENNGVAMSRTEIIENIWGGEGIWGQDEKLDVYISNIRKKIDKDFIETVKGFGYRIII